MDSQIINTQCCIAGGGPAGIMLGYLLARAGIKTTVLEKWPDFFRDFRGDTIHPSTMEVLQELGLLDGFLQLPHDETRYLEGIIGNQKVILADFSHLHVHCPFIAFIPQWDFLNFMVSQAHAFPEFHLLMHTEATDLIIENDKIIGLRAKQNTQELQIFSSLVVAADGRHSLLRNKSGLPLERLGVPMDVLWFRLSRQAEDPKQTLGRIDGGKMLVMLERGDYWQCGFLIRKGAFNQIREAGLSSFRESIVAIAPTLTERIKEINSWDQVKLLEVEINRLQKWYRPGFICIGDSAHAMSPIGGVGINLAIQDAIASANRLIPAFLQSSVTESDLAAIQKRRKWPTRVMQRIQVFIQNRVIDRVLGSNTRPQVPLIFKLLKWFPYLQRIPAWIIGIGVRPEHVNFKDKNKSL